MMCPLGWSVHPCPSFELIPAVHLSTVKGSPGLWKIMEMYWKIPCVIHLCVSFGNDKAKQFFSMFETETSTIHFCAKDGITWTAASSPQCPWLSVNKFISIFHPNIDSPGILLEVVQPIRKPWIVAWRTWTVLMRFFWFWLIFVWLEILIKW